MVLSSHRQKLALTNWKTPCLADLAFYAASSHHACSLGVAWDHGHFFAQHEKWRDGIYMHLLSQLKAHSLNQTRQRRALRCCLTAEYRGPERGDALPLK